MIPASTSWRWRFTASSRSASASASIRSSHSSSRSPRSASLIRPPALMRGPSAKPQVNAVSLSRACVTSSSAAMPGARAPRHHLQPLADQRPVHADQRHHVADGRQRHQVQQPHQVRLRPAGEKAQPAQRPHRRDRGQERHARPRTACVRPGACSPAGSD